MKTWFKLTAAAFAVVATSASYAAGSTECLDVRVSSANPVVNGDVDVHVDVAVTNRCRSAVQVLRWQLPSDSMSGSLFTVTRDDRPVRYTGAVIKRAAPTAKDYVEIAAGATLNYQVELTGHYDFSKNGRYAIEFHSDRGTHGSGAQSMHSAAATYLWTQGRNEKLEADADMATTARTDVTAAAASISYTGSCTSSQKSSLASAVTAATNYSVSSTNYLNGTPSATPRYTTWFGAYSSSRWNTAKDHFTKARNAFQGAALTLDCSCKDSGTYAYVYPTQPYKIYVCGAFWSAPMTGTDSKGGTLVHEMMHFNVIAGTDDWAYGQSAAKSLAKSSPTKALDNSDNHEYFAENNPAQN
ncbi:peptidyl-Lys metalloendopeptidase [Pelomonas saccharophila]|uniref:Peptidyl-Lys metalloendopeptidase n=1 Tax=Roseateles saccharophilus TaxID=304 RepID=A0ABU1YU23_ROSSA|nr:M35 family metallo-endopeptidase [Roseateles saccharophilus]MDR7272359.1 peptidyl-Lys metalloendopeptidase [Roseateles saccharophilus]